MVARRHRCSNAAVVQATRACSCDDKDALSTRAVVRARNERTYAGIGLDRRSESCQLSSATTNNAVQGPSRVCRASNRKHLQG